MEHKALLPVQIQVNTTWWFCSPVWVWHTSFEHESSYKQLFQHCMWASYRYLFSI